MEGAFYCGNESGPWMLASLVQGGYAGTGNIQNLLASLLLDGRTGLIQPLFGNIF